MPVPTHISSLCCPEAEPAFRLLYVGCDPELLIVLRDTLGEHQFQIVACSDRGSTILFLKSQIPYHLFLFDLEWRGAGGVKLARLAHSLRHREQTPVMLVAATKSARARAVLARKAGAAECVMKTQDMAGVTEAIKRLLGTDRDLGAGN